MLVNKTASARVCFRVGLVCVAAAASVLTAPAFPSSRVGNNRIVNRKDGFSVPLPPLFTLQKLTVDDGLVLIGLVPDQPMDLPHLTLRPFSVDFAELASADRSRTEAFFEGARDARWVRVSAPDCSVRYLGESTGAYVGVAAWGEGKGVTFLGLKTPRLRAAIIGLLENLDVSRAACGWKE